MFIHHKVNTITVIDISQYRAYLYSSVTSSKVIIVGSLKEVVKKEYCSGDSTWQQHYHKPIEKTESFELAILNYD